MEHGSLLRLFGLCSFIGGFLITLAQIWFYIDAVSFIATYFDHVGWFFITLGLIGLYLVQYRQIGGFGFISFMILAIGMFQWLGYKWFLTYVAPDLRRTAPELLDSGLQSTLYGVEFSIYVLQSGFFLFAVVSLFIGILSRWGLSLLLIGSALAFNAQMEPVVFYSPIISQVIIGLAFVWVGLSLFTRDQEHTYDSSFEVIPKLEIDEANDHESENKNKHDVKIEEIENSMQEKNKKYVQLEE